MFDKIFEELFSFSPELKGALKFLNDAEDYNVSIKEDNNNVSVTTDKTFTDDEYDEYVKGALATWKTVANLVDSEFVVTVKVGARPVDVYKFNKENNKFAHVEPTVEDKAIVKFEPYVAPKAEVKEDKNKNEGLFDFNKYKVDTDKLMKEIKDFNWSGNKFPIKDNTVNEQESTPLCFAADLKNRISKEIEEETEDLFDVDYAIEKMHSIFEEGAYDPIYNDEGEFTGIYVPVEYLVEEFDGCGDDACVILNEEGNNVYEFVNRCISELGFSNVIPECEALEDDYHTIVFEFVF